MYQTQESKNIDLLTCPLEFLSSHQPGSLLQNFSQLLALRCGFLVSLLGSIPHLPPPWCSNSHTLQLSPQEDDSLLGPTSHFCHFLPLSSLGTYFPPGALPPVSLPLNWPCGHVGVLYKVHMPALPLRYLPAPPLPCLGAAPSDLPLPSVLEMTLWDEASPGKW